MTARALACCLCVVMLAGANAFCGTEQKAKAKAGVPKAELVEKTGVIEIQKADPAKKEKYNTVLLKVGEETFKLVPSKAMMKGFKAIEKLGGKTVVVKGNLMPAKPPKYPLAAILVESFSEKGAGADAGKPAPAPTPEPQKTGTK